MMHYDWVAALWFIGQGVSLTLQYTLCSIIGGIVLALGLVMLQLSHYRMGRFFANGYISVFRGTPLLVQLSIVYFAIPLWWHIQISAFAAGVIAFSLNSAAYLAEVIRSGVLAIDKGQFEAARVLAIPPLRAWWSIILPQAIAYILPALVNEFISLLKETALISVLGEADIMRQAQLLAAEQYRYLEPLLIAALYYYFIVSLLTWCARRLSTKARYL